MQGMDTVTLGDLRERLLQRLLVITVVAAGIAYVPGVIAAWNAGLTELVVLDTVVWLAVLGLALWRRGSYRLRSALYLTIWFAFAVVLVALVGPLGGGPAWMLTVPVLAALLFGRWAAVLALAGILVIGVAYGVWLVAGGSAAGALTGVAYDIASWSASAGAVLFLGVILVSAAGSLLEGLARSIGDLKAANARLEEALGERRRIEAELVRSANTRALGTLAGRVAHDLNNLLVPILMAGDEARSASAVGSRQRQHLDLVVASAERARDLSRQVLVFGRDAPPERFPIAVASVVEEVALLLRSALPRGVALRLEVGAPEAVVSAGRGELHQVLMNLGTNAARALGGGGSTLVIAVELDAHDDQVHIRVSDDGPGIAPEHVERVFEPYFTTSADDSGTGLGLSIVKHVVDALGGSVEVASRVGEGTTVMVSLPRLDAALPVTSAEFAGAAGAATTDAARILLVDDDDLVRATTLMVLQTLGHDVVEAATPESALRRVHDEPDAFDVVVTDQAMPGMTGVDLAASLLALRPQLAVVLVSGFLDEATEARALEVGVRAVLTKPFDRRRLAEAIGAARSAVGAPGR
jgi:signal transduction histidine kinase/ActR/RegA family two-component response regulator